MSSPAVFTEAKHRLPAGNTSTGILKLIALVFMYVDHSGKVLFNNCQEMRILGRIAFPIYLWCMIVGFQRTRSVPKYLLRILIVGLVSQPLYVLALDSQGHVGTILQTVLQPMSDISSASAFFTGLFQVLKTVFYDKPNIFLTLLLGLGALWGIREKKFLSWLWAPAAALILATVLHADYGWKGVLLFILVYMVRDSRCGIAAVMISYFMYWGSSYSVTSSLFGIQFRVSDLPDFISGPLSAFMRMEAYALLALPLILIPMRRDLRLPKWLGYGLYPAHLVILILQKWLMFGW